MKLYQVILFSLAISFVAPQPGLFPRQDSLAATPNTASASQSSSTLPPTSTASDASASTTSSKGNDVSSIASSTRAAKSSANIPSETVTGASTQTSNATADPGDPEPLPITPTITPAIGVAGAILMITGLAYGLVGMKKEMLYRFFGMAYLVALAVTVLIIYCMNPPLSNGVQAGFLVAILCSGTLVGGASLIFHDITEGAGCMLGGFCLSMWFLCLKDGGLIGNKIGRIVFIACLSVGFYSLSFHRRTREIGLLGCIPFAGATATILGIDCFSRAGLKEMWIYVWGMSSNFSSDPNDRYTNLEIADINSDEFPLHTDTYPITRGMKVETAGVILLFVLGLMVHLRIAKLIEKRRVHKESVRRERAEELDREEAAVGRKIEEDNAGEMVAWNKAYDPKRVSVTTGPPSIDSTGKNSGNRLSTAQDKEKSQLSLNGEQKTGKGHKYTTVAIDEAESDGEEIQMIQDENNRLSAINTNGSTSKRGTMLVQQPSDVKQTSEAVRNSMVSSGPEVTPLPFKIPGVQTEAPGAPGSLSVIEEMLSPGRASLNRNSAVPSTWKRDSIGDTFHEESASIEDEASRGSGRASSLAATFDEREEDEMSLSDVSAPRSTLQRNYRYLSARDTMTPVDSPSLHPSDGSAPLDKVGDLVTTGSIPAIPEKSTKRNSISEGMDSQGIISPASSTQLSPVSMRTSLLPEGSFGEGTRNAEKAAQDAQSKVSSLEARRRAKSPASTSAVPSDQSESSAIISLKALLPSGPSKTERIFRTNEWSKHQDPDAAGPEEDIIEEPPSPGIKVRTGFRDSHALEHTPVSAVVDPDQFIVPPRNSKRLSLSSVAQESQRPKSGPALQVKRSSLNPAQPSRSPSGSSTPNNQSTMALDRPESFENRQASASRSSSNLDLLSTEAPVERPQSTRPTSRMGTLKQIGSASAPRPAETLLSKRDSLVKNKQTSMAFASSPNLLRDNTEDIPLSQHRKSLLQASSRPNSHRQDTWPSPAHYASTQSALNLTNLDNFDSHQPKRDSTGVAPGKRAERLTSWREQLREEPLTANKRLSGPGQRKTSHVTDEVKMQHMLNMKRQQEQAIEHEKKKKRFRDEAIEQAMRNGSLIDAHNRKLRAMEGGLDSKK
jgi:hypothetical protein